MIHSVSIINQQGERLDLVLRNPWESGFVVQDIDGLSPPKANINVSELSSLDGSVYNSARIPSRNIVLHLALLENDTIERSRHNLYKFLPIKSKVRFEVHTDERDIYTEGYVESNEITIFSSAETASISILCPDPYFYSFEDDIYEYQSSIGAFEFPFENEAGTNSLYFGEVNPNSDFEIVSNVNFLIGFEMDISILGGVGDLTISNDRTGQSLTIYQAALAEALDGGLQMGDIIKLSTKTGEKGIYVFRNGIRYNVLSALARVFDWVQLAPGTNILSVTGIGVANTNIIVRTKEMYEGV